MGAQYSSFIGTGVKGARRDRRKFSLRIQVPGFTEPVVRRVPGKGRTLHSRHFLVGSRTGDYRTLWSLLDFYGSLGGEIFHGRRIVGCGVGSSRRGRGVPLKLFRRAISQCRMQTQAIVVSVDELFRMLGKLVEIRILVAVDFLLFQGLHEAFTSRIIVGIGRTAHARGHVARFENPSVLRARRLVALLLVMHYSRRRLTPADGLL